MNNILSFNNDELMFTAVAKKIIELSQHCIEENGKFTIALSGGDTPKKLYELLAQNPYVDLPDWKNIFIFWGDERYLPITDENNNAHMAFTTLLNKVAVPEENVFPVPVQPAPADAAISYEKTIKAFFKNDMPAFDLILLGLGDNGHTASLFPHSSILNAEQQVKEDFITELNAYRISFTPALINLAANIIFLVTGKKKADILKIVLSAEYNPQQYPAQMIKPASGTLTWFTDREAASKLTNQII